MESLDPLESREAEFARFASSEEDLAALQRHASEIIRGPAFKGSHRSGQFLKYIIDQSIAGHFDSLKERLIGVELFGRSPSYDTGEDAIVRVTASDVRRRLLQHYGTNGKTSEFRLSLPLGSYIPEITRSATSEGASFAEPRMPKSPAQVEALSAQETHRVAATEQVPASAQRAWMFWRAFLIGSLATAAMVALVIAGRHFTTTKAAAFSAQATTLPWSNLLNSTRPVHLITSDPNIVVIQAITGSELSLSDYANHQYIPNESALTPEELNYCREILWGDNSAAAVDPPIAVKIGALAAMNSKVIDARAARSIQLSDLKADDNFIFLGSPRSDPWTSLFSDQLDFKFKFDQVSKQEIIVNDHPRAGEASKYVPTALGWATGQSYAVVAFIQNPDTNGQILMLAGADGEGTEAAGKFVTEIPQWSDALRACGIKPNAPLVHFEMLLGLHTMARSPSHIDVAACHILDNGTSR
jgi:hypothetical protein